MLIYFAASTSGIQRFGENYKKIIKIIKSFDNNVALNWLVATLNGQNACKNAQDAVRNEIKLLSQADFLMAEISVPSFGVGVAINQALSQKKPVLCLYSKSLEPSLVSDVFLGYYNNLLKLEYYDQANLRQIIQRTFEEVVQDHSLQKFNFLISPEIASYLEWMTNKTGQSKSQFLRGEIVKKIIECDENYCNLLKKNKR